MVHTFSVEVVGDPAPTVGSPTISGTAKVGKKITVKVTSRKSGYTTATKASKDTAKVA